MKNKYIPFNNGGGAVVNVDYDHPIFCITWFKTNKGYCYGKLPGTGGKQIFIHNMLMDSISIDHINHDKLDNRLDNLRIVNNRENCNNRTSHGIWPVGVNWNKHNKNFRGRIRVGKYRKYLGGFIDPITPSILYNICKNEIEDEKDR